MQPQVLRLWPHRVSASVQCRMKIKWPYVHCYLDLQILTAQWCHYLSVDMFKHNLFQSLRIPLPTIHSKWSENVQTGAAYSQPNHADTVAERKVNMGLCIMNPFFDHCVYIYTVTNCYLCTCTCVHVRRGTTLPSPQSISL